MSSRRKRVWFSKDSQIEALWVSECPAFTSLLSVLSTQHVVGAGVTAEHGVAPLPPGSCDLQGEPEAKWGKRAPTSHQGPGLRKAAGPGISRPGWGPVALSFLLTRFSFHGACFPPGERLLPAVSWGQSGGTVQPFAYFPSIRGDCRLSGWAGGGSPSSSPAAARKLARSPSFILFFLPPACCSHDEKESVPWKEFHVSLAVWQDKLEKEATSKREAPATMRYLQCEWVSQRPHFHEAPAATFGAVNTFHSQSYLWPFTVYA